MGFREQGFRFEVFNFQGERRRQSPVGGATGVRYTRRFVGGLVGWTFSCPTGD